MNTASLGSLIQTSRLYTSASTSTKLVSASPASSTSGTDFGLATQTSTSNLMNKYKGIDFTHITPNQFNDVIFGMYSDGIISFDDAVDVTTSDFHVIAKTLDDPKYNPDFDQYYNTPRNYLSSLQDNAQYDSAFDRARQKSMSDFLSFMQKAIDEGLSEKI